MFYSQCLLSKKGSLGPIWVAAYCFNKLNKALVSQTDIPSSVDKILHDEIYANTYRVLAYLLLGVVRIYSKKAEYLFDDCHEVLVQMKAFTVDKIDNVSVDTFQAPYHSITLPERFELDAFDLEILEDFDEGNMLPQREIMLKDSLKATEQRGNYFLDGYHCEDFAGGHDTLSVDHMLVEDVCSSYYMDMNAEASTISLTNLVERFQSNSSSSEECVNPKPVSGIDNEPPSENQPTDDNHTKVPETRESVKQMHVEASTGNFDDSREPVNDIELTTKDHLSDGDESEIEMHEVVNENHALRNAQTSVEKVVKNECLEEMDLEENVPGITRPFGKDQNREKLNTSGTTSSEKRCKTFRADNRLLITVDGTSQSKLLGAPKPKVTAVRTSSEKHPQMTSSEKRCETFKTDNRLSITVDGTPRSKLLGAHKLKVTAIRTPAINERPRLSMKRKCLVDDVLVLPNDLIRQSIQDPSDLVRKRRKVPITALIAWRARQISNLPNAFLQPVIPFISAELRSLFSEKGFTMLKSNKFVKSKKNAGASENVKMDVTNSIIGSETIMEKSLTVAIDTERSGVITPKTAKSSECMAPASETGVFETPTLDKSLENQTIAPENEILAPPTIDRPLERMMTASHSAAEANDLETSVWRDDSLRIVNNDVSTPPTLDEHAMIAPETPTPVPGPMRIFNNCDSPKPSDANQEKEATMSKDKQLDLTLIDEEINTFEGHAQEHNGFSERTRKVAEHLDECLLKRNKGEESVNIMQLAKGKTKKESARLFYEILVLATKGYAEVKQDEAYGDILVWKLPEWEHVSRR